VPVRILSRTPFATLIKTLKRSPVWVKILWGLMIILLIGRSLPYFAPIKPTDLVQTSQAIEFRDRHHLPLGTLLTLDQNHTAFIPLAQVSPQFIHAILAAEDQDFYEHGALDLKAIGRSLIHTLQKGKVTSGASTITMQLARMLEPSPRTVAGKAHEIWTAWRLAAGMSKDQILQAYINRLPMGGNIYGLEAAARTYLGMSATGLNLAQASLLAAIPNDPTYLNPYDYGADLKERQSYVLNRMIQDRYITKSDRDRAYAEQIPLQDRQQGIIAAPHFLFWLANQLSPNHAAQIETTIDRSLQQFVEAQVQQITASLKAHNVHHAAAVVIDNHSGEVLAYVGSPNYFAEFDTGRNDGVQALRQPGSTLKPFLYQFALAHRLISPNSILEDTPIHYAIPGGQLYSPTDYNETFQGRVRVRLALANSLNVPAVKVLEQVQVERFLAHLRYLGFWHLNQPATYYGLGLALGSGEVSLWELARAYVAIARQGEFQDLVTIIKDQKVQRPVLSSDHLNSDQSSWGLITDILSDRHARAQAFGIDSVLSLPFPTAVKTGTSSDFRDTWTVGFSRDYTVATWVGNFDGSRMQQVSGVTGAAPLWQIIMLHLHEHQEPSSFPAPLGLVQRPICADSGLRPTPSCTVVVQEYLYPQDLAAYDHSINSSNNLSINSSIHPEQVPQTLTIISPRRGDIFLTDGHQKLEFKLAQVPSQPVEWWLNGHKLPQTSPSWFWQLRPGSWQLEVRSEVRSGESRDQVNFKVELATTPIPRRGFSLISAEKE